MKGFSNWSRGPDIRVLTEAGVSAWNTDPNFRAKMERYALENTAVEGVPTEIRALSATGELLYSTPTAKLTE